MLRTIGGAWVLAIVVCTAADLRSPAFWLWFAIALLWPHLVYWMAHRAQNMHRAETINVLLDFFWFGVVAAFASFQLWPLIAMAVIAILNGILYGGPRFLLRAILPLSVGVVASLVIFGFHVKLESSPITMVVSVSTILFYTSLIATANRGLRRRQSATRKALEIEERKSNELLHNMLPGPIVGRLKLGEKPIADQFSDVTVIFADLVEFTPLAERLGARGTVLLLNDLFRRFDAAAARYGVEKIETTGDGYLAVAGAPAALCQHAAAAADFARALITAAAECAESNAERVQLRIGLHTGPIYGGVVGENRFHYKIFGDTVNIASRVQGQALPGRILVSATAHRALQATHAMEERGPVELKGHGSMLLYWLAA
ncbi:MAG: hypothetical protein KGN32_01080 [Burkholderiales bacterium]|nr:hypothetical protein [Burkholderiales bacterium]